MSPNPHNKPPTTWLEVRLARVVDTGYNAVAMLLTCLNTLDLRPMANMGCTLYRVFGFTFDGMYDPGSISVLHDDYQESSKIQKGCAEWSGTRPQFGELISRQCVFNKRTLYVMKHISCIYRVHILRLFSPRTAAVRTILHLEVKSATHGYIIRPTWCIYIHVICKDGYWLGNIGARSGTCHNVHLPAPGG